MLIWRYTCNTFVLEVVMMVGWLSNIVLVVDCVIHGVSVGERSLKSDLNWQRLL